MQISSQIPSIQTGQQISQTLKAQQAWEARRARESAKPEVQATPEQPTLQKQFPKVNEAGTIAANLSELSASGLQGSPQGPWQKTVQEVQSIAQRAGYVGVTEKDIHRAYTLGESLLADYRV